MKLDEWVEKIFENAQTGELEKYPLKQKKIIKENLKSLVEDVDVVGIGIGKGNLLYVYAIE